MGTQNRLEVLRDEIDRLILIGNPDGDHRKIRKYISHMYGVGRFCTLLALKRELNAELATTCGMLHDIYYMTGGSVENHTVGGAEQAREILQSMNAYSDNEIDIITTAILKHDDKDAQHEPYDELLKDADVLDHGLHNINFPVNERETARYNNLLAELQLTD